MIFSPNPELIFVHLPKAAGSSLSKVLESNYGESLYWINKLKEKKRINHGKKFKVLERGVRAMYGHIYAHPNLPALYPNAKFITWLRDPLERAISLYHFWEVLARENRVDHTDEPLKKFQRDKPSLEEFFTDPIYQPQIMGYQSYLGGMPPSAYFFAGRQEHFQEDIKTLGGQLLWAEKSEVKTNVNKEKKSLDPQKKEELKQLLSSEYKIYQSFLDHFHNGNP